MPLTTQDTNIPLIKTNEKTGERPRKSLLFNRVRKGPRPVVKVGRRVNRVVRKGLNFGPKIEPGPKIANKQEVQDENVGQCHQIQSHDNIQSHDRCPLQTVSREERYTVRSYCYEPNESQYVYVESATIEYLDDICMDIDLDEIVGSEPSGDPGLSEHLEQRHTHIPAPSTTHLSKLTLFR